jgi:hypothetical protein
MQHRRTVVSWAAAGVLVAVLAPAAPAVAEDAAAARSATGARATAPSTGTLAARATAVRVTGSGCDDEINNGDGTTTYVDTRAPDADAAAWVPAYVRVAPKGTPTTRLYVRFVETCSGVESATAVIANLRTGGRYAIRLALHTYNIAAGTEVWIASLSSRPADAGDWRVVSVVARDNSARFTVDDTTGQVVGARAPGNAVVDSQLVTGVQKVRLTSVAQLVVTPPKVKRGHPATVRAGIYAYTGRWAGVPGAAVLVQHRPASSPTWSNLAWRTTGASGLLWVSVRPSATTVYRALYYGNAVNASAVSSSAAVTVR